MDATEIEFGELPVKAVEEIRRATLDYIQRVATAGESACLPDCTDNDDYISLPVTTAVVALVRVVSDEILAALDDADLPFQKGVCVGLLNRALTVVCEAEIAKLRKDGEIK